jgi:hypothetical protein
MKNIHQLLSEFCLCGHSEWRHHRFSTSCMAYDCGCSEFRKNVPVSEPAVSDPQAAFFHLADSTPAQEPAPPAQELHKAWCNHFFTPPEPCNCKSAPPAQTPWTMKTVRGLWQMGGAGCNHETRWIDIANAHNADIDAEREHYKRNVDRISRELAKERFKLGNAELVIESDTKTIQQLQQQLDAAVDLLRTVPSGVEIEAFLAKIKEGKELQL